MQSSFNVIKNSSVVANGKKEINTDYSNLKFEVIGSTNNDNDNVSTSIQASYENLSTSILENARRQSEKILTETYKRAQEIEKEAYERGYELGQKQAYTDTYDRAYEEQVIKSQSEAEVIINKAEEVAVYAENLLLNSKKEYEKYFSEKTDEIKELILNSVKNILHKEIQSKDALNEMIIFALDQIKNGKTFIVKCNKNYVEELRNCLDSWKNQLTFKCDIFVIEDETVDLGNVIIEKDNGHLEVGIDVGFSKLKQIILRND